MPVEGLQNKAFIGRIQLKMLFLRATIIVNATGTLQANSCLDGRFMAMTSPLGSIYSVDIKDPFNVEWDGPFNDR